MKRKQNLSKKIQPTMTKEQLSTFINAALDKGKSKNESK